jgi:uncharacterized membrane protein
MSQEVLASAIRALRLALEVAGALWITVGGVYAMAELVAAYIRRSAASFTPIRLGFSRYLSLALEFQLASDILSTAIAPSWDEIGKLGATATIRTALNYFLSREMREYTEKEAREENVVSREAES